MTGRPVVAALNLEWRELAGRRPEDWAFREPELAGAEDLGDLPRLVRARPDPVLAALLRLGTSGEPLAHRVVLQVMLGKVVRLCARRPDQLADAVSELWLAIVAYPVQRRPACIASNLAWSVHRSLLRPLPGGGRAAPDMPSPSPCTDAASTLDEARRLRLIDQATHRILWTVYVAGRSSAQAAAELGTTPELVRWRCSRALRRLAGEADLLTA